MMGSSAARTAARTFAVEATAPCAPEISMPARSKRPPFVTKSFCMSTTITAVVARSTSIDCGCAWSVTIRSTAFLSSSNRAHDEKGLGAFRDRVRQGSVGRFMRDVFTASEEANQWPALEGFVFADRAAQHRVFLLQCSDNRMRRHGAVKIDTHFIANFCEGAEMMRQNHANHKP